MSCVESVLSESTAMEMRTPDMDHIHIAMLFFDMAVSYSEGSQ